MLIEEAFPAKDSDGIVTVGMMRGTIKNGDAAYLLETGDRICMVNVIGLAVQDAVFSRIRGSLNCIIRRNAGYYL